MGPEVFKLLPVDRPPRDGEKLNTRSWKGNGIQKILPLPEPHRVRVVELKPHKGIQVIRGHPYEGEMGVRVTASSQEPST